MAARGNRLLALFVLSLAVVASGAAPAPAAFPGLAGPIAYQRLAFLKDGATGGLFAHGPSRAGPQRTLSSDADAEEPAYSPDGRLIVFAADLDAVAETRSRLYLMRADGSGVRELTGGAERDSHPSFSPDGRRIIFDRTTTGYDNYAHIYEVGVDGSGLRQLTRGAEVRDTDPTFAPGGRAIAFVSERGGERAGRFGLFVMRPDGARLRPLIDGPRKEEEPDYSPDGRSIAFVSNIDGSPNISVARADGGRPRQLTNGRRGCFSGSCFLGPTWAPDGRHIAFVAQDRYSSDLKVMLPDGRRVRLLVEGGEGEDHLGSSVLGPAWGPAPR
jgi:Tol biopolymer transport system component